MKQLQKPFLRKILQKNARKKRSAELIFARKIKLLVKMQNLFPQD